MTKEEMLVVDSMDSLRNSFRTISSSEEYEFYLEYLKDLGTLYLDNDDTYFIFDNDYKEDPEYLIEFSYYLGNAQGLKDFLKASNIEYEEV